jgi:hypothetical protein
MKKNQKEIYLPNEGGSGNANFKPSKSKFIYYVIAILAIAGLIAILAL